MPESRILLVDDDPAFLLGCQSLLESAGYKVSTAGSGTEALARIAKTPQAWELMVLDMNMPGMDGLSVLKDLQTQDIDIAVVVLSGETSFQWVSKAFQYGAFDYIRKPFEYADLLHTLNKAVKKREQDEKFFRLRRQLERSERLHRFMIESSPDIIFIVDRDGMFKFINDRATDLLGYSKEELIGEHYSVIIDPDSIATAQACFSERRESRAAKDEEVWLLCKSGPTGERRRIAIELNAMGVYEHESIDEHGETQQRDFSGTYVVARDVTERLSSQKMIHYQAYHDLLTGLPNRALFLDRLTTAINNARRNLHKLAVMFLDLDRFKIVNDTLGHDMGDALLKLVAEKLAGCLRESDTLARLGGDEFIILLPQLDSTETAATVADKIVKAIKQPFHIDNHELFVTTSVGIAIFPDDGEHADTLIKNADIAMYHTKAKGKDGFNIFTRELSAQQKEQLSIENDIRRGIRENQFLVYYQPQVSLTDGTICGVEALLRWDHPERGLLTPSYFLPVAIDSSLIVELGDWLKDTAITEVQRWRRDGLDVRKLSVNISHREIEQADFVDNTINVLKAHELPAECFEIDITEGSLLSDGDKTLNKLRQLHSFGIHIAIDDFGTGYSSLSLLQKLPINRLKIDRSFIQDLQTDADRSIIEAIAHMAKGLKLEMVAEGVEQEYQLRYLSKLKCPVVQGYIYSPPLPASEMRQLLEDGKEFGVQLNGSVKAV